MIEVRQVRRHIPGIPLGGGSILPRGRLPEVSPEVKVTRMSRDMWSVARDRIFLGSSPPPSPRWSPRAWIYPTLMLEDSNKGKHESKQADEGN